MKAAGIVAEFNPLHNGHVYIMEETRRLTNCDALVVAMSGNFVQRGEPAIIDKWKRTEAALSCGADLVIEIPTLFCLSDAGKFAGAGVHILEEAGCDYICCGSESGNNDDIYEIASLIKDNKERIEGEIAFGKHEGLPYPAIREKIVLDLISDEGLKLKASEILAGSNDILALEYMMAARSSKIIPVKRKGADYNDCLDNRFAIQSASGIRDFIGSNEKNDAVCKLSSYLPDESLTSLVDGSLVFLNDTSNLLRYSVISKDAYIIDECPSGGEGIGHLVKSAVLSKENTADIIKACKSRRYTYTRLSRLCMQILLGIDRRIHNQSEPSYLRVLGFNNIGRELLSELKKSGNSSLPIITNINKEAELLNDEDLSSLFLDIKATDLYSLISGRKIDDNSEHRFKPVIIE